MNALDVPLRRADVESVELDGEMVVHDPRSGTLHLLNESAASVWAACDGSTTVAAIVRAMQETHAGPADEIAHDVDRALTELRSQGLVDVPRADQSRIDPSTT